MRRRGIASGLPFLGMMAAIAAAAFGCEWSPARPFERNAPEVDQAIRDLDAGEAGSAASILEGYLGTGQCSGGSIGVPDRAVERHNATFDLGLALFRVAEQYGARFGQEDSSLDGGPTPEQQAQARLRSEQVDCALRLLDAIASAPTTPIDLAARARYLQGNLEFLRGQYRAAVDAYDKALMLFPGVPPDAGDTVGSDAAWNRAIALRRIEDENKRDAGNDEQEDQDAAQDQDAGAPDGSQDGPQEAGEDGGQDASSPDAGKDAASDGGQGNEDGGADGAADGQSPEPQSSQPEAGAPDGGAQPPQQTSSQDDRILDMLESAPTVQLQDAKNRASRRRVKGMADK